MTGAGGDERGRKLFGLTLTDRPRWQQFLICSSGFFGYLVNGICEVTAVTLLLSYLIFTKPMTEQHVTGLLLISMGIVLKLLPENGPRRQVKMVQHSEEQQGEIGVEEEKMPRV